MFADFMTVVVVLAVSATVLFAWTFGGRTERIGGALFAANVAVNFLLYGAFQVQGPLLMLSCDLATAAAFGVLALSAPEKLWPGVAAVGQTLVVTFSATRMLDYPLGPLAYVIALNLSGVSVEVALVVGTWRERWGVRPAQDDLLYA